MIGSLAVVELDALDPERNSLARLKKLGRKRGEEGTSVAAEQTT